jgi:hypothetical protein
MFLKAEHFQAADPAIVQKNKVIYFLLLWLLGFFIVVRFIALFHFLSQLDYSEVNTNKLIIYLCIQAAPPLLLSYFLRLLYLRPHKAALSVLAGLSLLGYIHWEDPVVFTATSLLLLLIGTLYFRLYHASV